MKHDFPLPLQQIWNVFWEMLKHPFEHKESLGEDKGATGSEEKLLSPSRELLQEEGLGQG